MEELTINQYKFWTAVAVLGATILTSLLTLRLQRKQLGSFGSLLQQEHIRFIRPLDGEWDFELDYTKFHNDETPDKFKGTGRATFLWIPADQHYKIWIFLKINESGVSEEVVTSIGEATLKGDASGWSASKTIKVKYFARTGRKPYESKPFTTTDYTGVKVTPSKDGQRGQRIDAQFCTSQSAGKVVFLWRTAR